MFYILTIIIKASNYIKLHLEMSPLGRIITKYYVGRLCNLKPQTTFPYKCYIALVLKETYLISLYGTWRYIFQDCDYFQRWWNIMWNVLGVMKFNNPVEGKEENPILPEYYILRIYNYNW